MLRKKIRRILSLNKIKALYIYGSYIRNDKSKKSDINLLGIINKDIINFIKNRSELFDLTFITQDEIINGAHASFNSFYYINLIFSSVHLYGKDILLKLFSKYPDYNSAVFRVQCIMQRIRNILINNIKKKEEKFWFSKLNHWLYLVISEFLFFTKGIYTPNLKTAKKIFEKSFFKIDVKDIRDLYKIYSKIKKLYLKFSSNDVRIRVGAFLIIKNERNEYLMLERRDKLGYEFVKGGVITNEDFRTTIQRECEEEIGLRIEKDELIELPLSLSFKYPIKNGYEIRIYKGFLLTLKNSKNIKLKLDKNFSDYKFMKIKDALIHSSFPEYKEVLRETDEIIKKGLIFKLHNMYKEFKTITN